MSTLESLQRALRATSVLAALSVMVAAQSNETPSSGVCVVVSPNRWEFDGGEATFLAETGMPNGQQYITLSLQETVDPGLNPTIDLIDHIERVNGTYHTGVLLHTGHGGADRKIGMENFRHADDATAMAAAQARLTQYGNAAWDIAGADREIEIIRKRPGWWLIAMFDRAITNRGAGLANDKPLVYIATCHGSAMGPAYVGRGARAWVGDVGCAVVNASATRVETFFKRMNGQEGQLKRPVSAARAAPPDVMMGLAAGGQLNTTLAPSVLSIVAPCPIKNGDFVTFTMDTTCEMGNLPDIVGFNCTIQNEVWLNTTTLRGTCTAPAAPGANRFVVTLTWQNTYSDNNTARLDGNTNPTGRNARGPAHDDFRARYLCTGAPSAVPDFSEVFETIGTAYCFGDGSGAICPCLNNGDTGQGCANSTGSGATLAGAGSTNASADDLVFTSSNLLPNQPALLFAGLNAVNDGNGMAFGDGLHCAGGNVVRLGVEFPNAQGLASWGPGLAEEGGWNPGDMRRFQVWYRNASGSPCGTGVNLSHGVEVTFTP